MTRFFEELALSALPALETVFLDGWVLRFTNGYTRRANSVNPLYPGKRPLADQVGEAEDFYRRRGQRVIFKLTRDSLPAGLDSALAERGYAREAPTSLQTLDLAAHPPVAAGTVILSETLTETWLAVAFELNALPESQRPTMRQSLARLAPQHCFAALSMEGVVVSLALSVLQSGYLGLFDLVTRPGQRGRGYGHQVLSELLAWGVAHGAHTAYLQVMQNNVAGLRLYQYLGFLEQYEYWYRVKE